MIAAVRQGLKDEGVTIPLNRLCEWFGCRGGRCITVSPLPEEIPRSPGMLCPADHKALIEREPTYGYHIVAHLLGFNKNTVQQMFQQMG